MVAQQSIEVGQLGSMGGMPTRAVIASARLKREAATSVQRVPTLGGWKMMPVEALAPPIVQVSGTASYGESPGSPLSIRVKNTVYPPTEIVIGSARRVVTQRTSFCRFTVADGIVQISTYS